MPALATIRVDAKSAKTVEQAIERFGRQGRYAFARTLNDLVLQGRDAVRGALRGALTVRTAQTQKFLEQRVQIPRDGLARVSDSKGDRLSASLLIADPEGFKSRGRATLLATLSSPSGGEKAQSQRGPLAVPTPALRPSKAAVIPRGMYPVALGVGRVRTIEGPIALRSTVARRTRGKQRVRAGDRVGLFRTAKGRFTIRGKLRTFAIDPFYHPRAKSYGVFQRFGPGKGDIRKLWKYVPRVPVPPRVPAQRILNAITRRQFAERFSINLREALRTAR